MIDRVGLAVYQSCTFTEKRAVLRTFWSGHEGESDKVVQAAREYGPYAFVMIAIITVELIVISSVLLAASNGWAWLAMTVTLLAGVSAWWTGVCQRAMRLHSTNE